MLYKDLDKHQFSIKLSGLEALALFKLVSDYAIENDPMNERAKAFVKYIAPSVFKQLNEVKELEEREDRSNIIEYGYARRRFYERSNRLTNSISCFYGG